MHRQLRRLLILLLCLEFQAWSRADASNLRFQIVPDPTAGLTPVEIQEGPPPIPAGWRWAPYTPNGDYPTGLGDFDVTLDPRTGNVLERYREGSVEVREPLVLTRDEYNEILTQRNMRKMWRDKTRQTRSVARGQGRSGGLFRVELPVQFPKVVRSIVGDGAPNIEITGSENISLAGTSNWTASPIIQTEHKNQSAFPSLEMKQDLNVNLTGSIGDKIKIDVDQSSNVQTSIDNKVKLRYEGDEDDMIRSVELGNTNLSVEGASFRQEGLFGIKSELKLGNVDLVTIASKQQGKTESARFTPSGQAKQVRVNDIDYIHRQYFLIADHPIDVNISTLRVYKDDFIVNTASGEQRGASRFDPTQPVDSLTNPELAGKYNLLTQGTDYTVFFPWVVASAPNNTRIPVIKLQTPLQPNEVLAVAYEDKTTGAPVNVGGASGDSLLLKMIKPRLSDIDTDPNSKPAGLFQKTSPWYRATFYELKNFYDLGGRDIALETLNLRIRRIQLGEANDPDALTTGPNLGKPLIEILGLDQKGQPGSLTPNAPDGKVDDQYLDPKTGVLFFPDMHPFYPNVTDPCGAGFNGFACFDDTLRNTLRLDPQPYDPANEATPLPYYVRTTDELADPRFYIDADFKSSQQGFSLGRFDIIEGSETVKVDGIPKLRGTDYSIDYTTGQLTFVNSPGPNQTITVDFSFAPGVGSTQLTLLGGSATYQPGPNLSVTSSLLYDDRGAQERYPKLGEEPARTVIGDLASLVTFHPVWMTGLANAIPGVRTNAQSLLNIQGHVSTSLPNPNTAGEGYVDDMEGNRESNTASLSRTQWFWSSVPLFDMGADSLAPITPLVSTHCLVDWFNARNVHEVDLKPVLTQAEGAQNEHTTLEVDFKPPTGGTVVAPEDWAGLTQSLGATGQDFSKLKYLEIWVNDFTPDHTRTQAKLHIDFGTVSEDAFWDPNNPPNGKLDTEDKNRDGKLDRSNDLSLDEDTGLDGLHDSEEPGYDAATNPDPDHDDYPFKETTPGPNYVGINNTEGNGGDPNARPDTEDLNHDGFFQNTENNYFEATLNLADTNFVAVDVPKDYAGDPDVKAENGWRLFRVPLTGDIFRRVNAADWEDIENMRVWVNGMSNPTKLQIGGIELVGNHWLAQPIDSAGTARGAFLLVGNRNNKDDAGFYTSPYDVQNQAGSTAKAKEQSLALRYGGVTSADTVLAFKTVPPDAGGLGWTQYRDIRFWVHGDVAAEAQKVRVMARFGPDTVNYYEYSIPVKSDAWQDEVIPMERLSSLKLKSGVRIEADPASGEVFRVVGNPSFTRIIRISFGLTLDGVGNTAAGEMWIDDLRLSDVRRDNGMRQDLTVQANFADVLAMNVSYQNQDENFFRVGTGVNQGTGINHVATGFSSTFQLDRLMPSSGVQLPVRFSMTHSSDLPKFQTGSDVVLNGAQSDLQKSESNQQSVDLSYRRNGGRTGLARYTLNALSGGLNYTRSANITTNNIDSSWAFNVAGAYDLPIGGGGFSLGRKMKINLLPDVVGFTTNWRSSRGVSYSRAILEDRDSTDLRSDVLTRLLGLGGSSSWTPLSAVVFKVTVGSQRNLLLPQEGFFGFNKGTEVDHVQTLELRYTPRWLGFFGSPNVTLNGRYHESAQPTLRILATDPEGTKNIDNGGSARATAAFPLGRIMQRFAPPSGTRVGPLNPFLAVRMFISHLQDIQGSFSFERGSVITRVTGDPGFAFMTGFTEVAGPKMTTLNNSNFSTSRAYISGANTSFRPVSGISVDVRADHRLTYSDGSGLGARRNLSMTLPDLQGRWNDLHRLLGLQSTLSSMTVKTGYNFRREEAGPEGGSVETRTNTTTWGPLLGWDLVWKNGLRASITTNATQASQIDLRVFGFTSERDSKSTEVRFTKTYPSTRGIRFPWSKHPIKLPNDLNLNLAMTAGADKIITKQTGQPDIPQIDTSRLEITSGTNYNFTQAISGGFNLGFRQNKDEKTLITTRGLTVGLNAQFRF